ncbi:MAG: molybdopterin-dependent oxidoreductase, partial [Erythrobacter sp.]|nr:molybdopterin-dependent oxidoreductase [Erythrobacter sp.]
GLLAGAAAGGGLLLAWSLWPRDYSGALEPGPREHGFGAWLTVGEDGVVTVAVPQLEMGQGVTTLLPQLVAMEMGAAWGQVAVAPIPPTGAQANVSLAGKWAPLWASVPALVDEADGFLAERFARSNAFAVTAEGSTLAAFESDCRAAGAAARAMLAMAAAKRWDVAWEECEVAEGIVTHGQRRARFGELAAEAARMTPPDPPLLRPQAPMEEPLPGDVPASSAYPRLDLPAKVDGSFPFAGDIRLPGMVYASIRHGVWGLRELVGFDEAAARGAGLVALIRSRYWLAAVADSWWKADRALDRMRPRFAGPGGVESEDVERALDEGLERGEAQRIASIGEPEAMQTPTLTRRYDIAPALHAPIETASATALYRDGRLQLWIASQAPAAARRVAAKAIGLSERDVAIYPMAAGGSFDARLETMHAIEAAQIARQIGRPIQLTWPRGEEFKAVPPRTPVSIALSARLDPNTDRQPIAWRAKLAMPATMREFGARLFDDRTYEAAMEEAAGEADPLACEGAVPPYAIPNVVVDHAPVTIDLPTARMRGNSAVYTGFATECFLDELAEEAQRDPLLYRLSLLGQDARAATVLRAAARLGEWDGGVEGTSQGLALIRMAFGQSDRLARGFIACVAQARLGEGGVRVDRLSAVADIGRIPNLDIARQQIEGGLIFGLSLATGSSATYRDGMPETRRLAGLMLPTLGDAPDLRVDFLASEEAPFDPGELGVAVAPPAIANALHAATGLRFRRLPLLSEGL